MQSEVCRDAAGAVQHKREVRRRRRFSKHRMTAAVPLETASANTIAIVQKPYEIESSPATPHAPQAPSSGGSGQRRRQGARKQLTFGLMRELEIRSPPGTRQHFTQPPFSTAPAKTLRIRHHYSSAGSGSRNVPWGGPPREGEPTGSRSPQRRQTHRTGAGRIGCQACRSRKSPWPPRTSGEETASQPRCL